MCEILCEVTNGMGQINEGLSVQVDKRYSSASRSRRKYFHIFYLLLHNLLKNDKKDGC